MNTVASASPFLDTLLAGLSQQGDSHAPALGGAGLKALRGRALERVGALTLPSVHDESWRFTSLSALTRQSFQPLRTPTTLQADDIAQWHLKEAATRLVFVDGVYAPQLSSPSVNVPAADGAVVCNLLSVPTAQAAAIAADLGRHMAFDDALFPALNTALLQDAAVVRVPRNGTVATPVHVLCVSTQPDVASHPRLLVLAETGSAVTLVEDYVVLHDGSYLTNTVVEVVLQANAQVTHVRVQRESAQAFHMASGVVALGRASRYHLVNVALGAHISRLDLTVQHAGDGAECTLDGLALVGGQQLADTHTVVDHTLPQGVSRQLHKCIVGGNAHAVFHGKVMVRPGAQKTDSAQSSRSLLLSSKARVDTQPQLEIFADDVKCTHGATVGQLDSEEVFYLQSRGLSEAAARNLLTYAFAGEIINRIPVASLRQQLERAVLVQTQDQQ
jgi:Fe-S cluster assembly protein SufD